MVRVRYGDGEEEDICQGAVHRPYQISTATANPASPSRAPIVNNHIERPSSPPAPYVGHASSVEDLPTESSSDSDHHRCIESETTIIDRELLRQKTQSRPACIHRQCRSDSEATLFEDNYDRRNATSAPSASQLRSPPTETICDDDHIGPRSDSDTTISDLPLR
jgi:hypothetical protein